MSSPYLCPPEELAISRQTMLSSSQLGNQKSEKEDGWSGPNGLLCLIGVDVCSGDAA